VTGPGAARATAPEAARGAAADHLGWLDLIRVLAAVAVVLVHVVAPWVTSLPSGTPGWHTANVLDAAVRWCVPVFVMTSGALLLDPRHQQPARTFYRRRAARVLVPLLCWTALYLALRAWWLEPGTPWRELLVDVARGSPFLHLYFLFLLVGLYLVTPLLRLVVQHTPGRRLGGFVVVLLAVGVVDQALQACCSAGEPNAVTRFVPFLGYYLGGWWAREHLPRMPQGALVAVVAASVAVTAGLAAWTARDGWGTASRFVYGFLAPWVVVMSFAVFAALRDAHPGWLGGGALRRLAGWTFGVFLVHPLVLVMIRVLLRGQLPVEPATAPAVLGAAALLTALTLAGSWAVVVVLARVPGVRHTVT
jgi:surface polysaccharide O-acyltransferase-like enzyme